MRPAVALIILLGAAIAPLASAQEPLPGACARESSDIVCQWTFDNREDLKTFYSFEVPLLARMLATITVVEEGADGGWQLFLTNATGEGLEDHAHTPRSEPSQVVRTTLQTLVLGEAAGRGWLNMSLLSDGVGVDGANVFTGQGLGPASVGAFTLTYSVTELPAGVAPARPAATREDPHLSGAMSDARRGAFDLRAAWFDDALVGDGLFDAHVAVSDLSDGEWAEGGVVVIHRLSFTVLGVPYRLDWDLRAVEPAPGRDDVDLECSLVHVLGPTTEETVLQPWCTVDWDASVVTAYVPERSVGSPGDGTPFTAMSAQAERRAESPRTGYSSSLDTLEDEMSGERYPFALGGPAVWDELNPRLAVPPVAPAAWYEAPLAKENVPDTLQVVGALLAGATFLGGAVLVQTRLRRTRELLARVDAVAEEHARDGHRGLVALGALEFEFTRLFRDGKITEAQFQLAIARLSHAATRMHFRHTTGLDDGVAGDATRARR